MPNKITLTELSERLKNTSSGQLLRELHTIALDYAAKGETFAKGYASTRLNVRSGRLVASIAGRVVKRKGYVGLKLSAGGGGDDVKYAATHEYGATIRPVNAKYLAIPIHPSLKTAAGVGKVPGPRDIGGLAFAQSLKGQPLLVHQKTGAAWFLLRQQVKIPARPYLAPAMELVEAKMIPEVSQVLRGVVTL